MIEAIDKTLTLGNVMIEQQIETQYLFEILVPLTRSERITVYLADVYGADQTFMINRCFRRPEMDYCADMRIYSYQLKDGVYEVGYNRYCAKDGMRLERLRYLMILLEGKQTLYPYDELGSEGVLYTAFNVWLQVAGEKTACRLFLRKGERRDG